MGTETSTYNIQLQIDSKLDQVRLLGGAVRGIGHELALSDEQLGQIELILVEAVNNVIEHAYEFESGNDVKVRMDCKLGESVNMVISDRGRSMPEERAAQNQSGSADFPNPNVLPEGGWGLGLITLLADSFHYERDGKGNHLHVSKCIA